MTLPIFQVDAFANELFSGNPAAVCPLESWLPDETLQSIALENNLSETAFFVKSGDGFALRWFTPTVEVDLCGHATLATAHVLLNELGVDGNTVVFETKSGRLSVERKGNELEMDFPADEATLVPPLSSLTTALGVRPSHVYKGRDDLLVLFGNEATIARMKPNMTAVAAIKARGVIVTAPGTDEVDFVSRFFGPQSGVPEDPVTGSAHTLLAPFWAERLGKTVLKARQLSGRGGDILCTVEGNRVKLRGGAVTYMKGEIRL